MVLEPLERERSYALYGLGANILVLQFSYPPYNLLVV
jgi:hypothetical protein